MDVAGQEMFGARVKQRRETGLKLAVLRFSGSRYSASCTCFELKMCFGSVAGVSVLHGIEYQRRSGLARKSFGRPAGISVIGLTYSFTWTGIFSQALICHWVSTGCVNGIA
jgi:hypothetical protein